MMIKQTSLRAVNSRREREGERERDRGREGYIIEGGVLHAVKYVLVTLLCYVAHHLVMTSTAQLRSFAQLNSIGSCRLVAGFKTLWLVLFGVLNNDLVR